MNSKNKFKLTIPILYLAFNRLDTVKKTFPKIRKARPKELYISVDGPRNKKEKSKTDKVRKYILDNIDWSCDVKTKFPGKNLGCEVAVSHALDWYFKNVEMGIVLEDDCLPSDSFFRYCQELLIKYKDDERITSIYGTTPVRLEGKVSYAFTGTIGLWGWASWARAWNKIYRSEEKYMGNLGPKKYLKEVFPNMVERINFSKKYMDFINSKVNTWEFPWQLGIIRSKGLNVIPKVNLIENIGVDVGFTNTVPNPTDKKFLIIKRDEIKFPLKHPKQIRKSNMLRLKFVYRDYKRILIKRFISLFEKNNIN